MPETRDPVVGDFLEAPASAPVSQGVYRVVGTPDDDVVLLRVTGERGRRAHTGDLERVDATDAVASLEPATEPWPTLTGFLRNLVQGPYWMVRSLLQP